MCVISRTTEPLLQRDPSAVLGCALDEVGLLCIAWLRRGARDRVR